MWSAATVLVCALDLLGRSASALPPIVFVDVRPPDVSARAEAFVRTGDETIYLVTSTAAFQRVVRSRDKCGELNALRQVASVLVHEEWHVRHGPGERGAYQAQLMALLMMGAGPGTPVYTAVARARSHVLDAQRSTPLLARSDAPSP